MAQITTPTLSVIIIVERERNLYNGPMETEQPQEQPTKKERRDRRKQEKAQEQQQRKLTARYRRIALWLVVAMAIGGGVFGMVHLASLPPPAETAPAPLDAIADNDWVKGNRTAKVVLIEYSDFQCPACAAYYPLVKKIAGEFGDKIAIVYRHLPLPTHRNAKTAAYAAEAAGRQGKFWEMHDLLFTKQDEWKGDRSLGKVFIYTNYAETLNLNMDQFKDDFTSKEVRTKIDRAYQKGLDLKLAGTPTFFLNGKKVALPRDYGAVRGMILQAIDENP